MARELVLSLNKSDFRIDTFRAGGKGGQKQNKTESAARITHIATGISYESRLHREQSRNKKDAFNKLCSDKRFVHWLKTQSNKLPSIDSIVDKMMDTGNLKIEYGVVNN